MIEPKFFSVLNFERVYSHNQLPKKGKKEIVFIGRSNVGKSSLINALLNHSINRVSKTPGCTKWIGYIELPTCVLIDLPGYGYAKISREKKSIWNDMILRYIESGRIDLVFQLIDSRRGMQELDFEIDKLFNMPLKNVFTKCDEKDAKKHEYGLAVSSHEKTGLEELRKIIIDF